MDIMVEELEEVVCKDTVFKLVELAVSMRLDSGCTLFTFIEYYSMVEPFPFRHCQESIQRDLGQPSTK